MSTPRFITYLAAMLCVLAAGCATRHRATSTRLDPQATRVEQQVVRRPQPKGEKATIWNNTLTFSNAPLRVPLAPSALVEFDGGKERYGFDPSTLKARWLKKDSLLWVRWESFRQGSGGYAHQGHVLVNVQHGKGHEVFRDIFQSSAKAGWAAQKYDTLDITFDDKRSVLELRRRSTEILGEERRVSPASQAASITNSDGQSLNMSETITIDVWRYHVSGNDLKFIAGTSSVDFAEEARPIDEICRAFQISRSSLDAMNPRLRDKSEASGVIVLNDHLSAYRTFGDGDNFRIPE